jgi:hypothetical protein
MNNRMANIRRVDGETYSFTDYIAKIVEEKVDEKLMSDSSDERTLVNILYTLNNLEREVRATLRTINGRDELKGGPKGPFKEPETNQSQAVLEK